MKKVIYLFGLLFAFSFSANTAFAVPPSGHQVPGEGTPDLEPPAEEEVCNDLHDNPDVPKSAYGLCVAYCEAQDCDEYGDKESCDVLYANWLRAWSKFDDMYLDPSEAPIPCGGEVCYGDGGPIPCD